MRFDDAADGGSRLAAGQVAAGTAGVGFANGHRLPSGPPNEDLEGGGQATCDVKEDQTPPKGALKTDDPHILDIRVPVGVFASSAGLFAHTLLQPIRPDALDGVSPLGADGLAGASLVGVLPAIYPEWLGGGRFTAFHGCRFPYVVGAMARGITTARMVVAAAEHGLLGFFGAAGLRPAAVADAIGEIKAGLGSALPWGSNLIHSPDRPDRERAMVDLYLEQSVSRVSASAFMDMSPEIVRYSAHGLVAGADGTIDRRTHVFAKVSHTDVAAKFMVPPPADLLRELAAAGRITEQQAELHSGLPVAEDITVEADSGGHTDNRPLSVVFPIIATLRDEIQASHGYGRPIRLGAAGGLGSPRAVAAAFQLGADYVLTGSVNQSAVESGLSENGRVLLADCGFADVTMAPAADMFERGVKVQVLKKGTMFAVKAQRIYDLYRRHDGFEALPDRDRSWLESKVFLESCADAWARTRGYHENSNPALAGKADVDPKLRMALTFRRYLMLGAHWAREGHADRHLDYQIWCGPAMGAFNDWVRDSFLEPVENRTVGQIALNLLESACVATRIQQLRLAGIDPGEQRAALAPNPLSLG